MEIGDFLIALGIGIVILAVAMIAITTFSNPLITIPVIGLLLIAAGFILKRFRK